MPGAWHRRGVLKTLFLKRFCAATLTLRYTRCPHLMGVLGENEPAAHRDAEKTWRPNQTVGTEVLEERGPRTEFSNQLPLKRLHTKVAQAQGLINKDGERRRD